MNKDLTPQRAVILRSLASGPKSWSTLRLEYYGEARAKSRASTSFNNQLGRMQSGGFIEKVMGGFAITEVGRSLLQEGVPMEIKSAKTRAQLSFEGHCKHTLVTPSGQCLNCGKII